MRQQLHPSPLLAPLVMPGWGASIGAVIGAAVGATATAAPLKAAPGQGGLSTLVGDAIADGLVVLVAQTRTAEQTRIARDRIRAAVGDCRDVVTA